MFTPLIELNVFVVIVAVVAVAVAVAATVGDHSWWDVGATVAVVAVAEKPWRVAATA